MALILPFDNAAAALGGSLLRAGKLVAFPTETVYGLGADATNSLAVARIYEVKERPSFNPLIVHVHNERMLDGLVVWTDAAKKLAKVLWPGPITLILPKKKGAKLSQLVSAGLDTVAVRIPNHPAALALLREAKRPIAAPSANISGKLSPTTAEHVIPFLEEKIDLIINGGACPVGLESTVIDVTSPTPVIMRHGAITPAQIEAIVGTPVTIFKKECAQTPASPGMLTSHYAPHIPVRLNAEKAEKDEAFLAFGKTVPANTGKMFQNLSPTGDLIEAAANLFAMLHELDRPQHTGIAVAPIPEEGLGLAINDRLRRAAATSKK